MKSPIEQLETKVNHEEARIAREYSPEWIMHSHNMSMMEVVSHMTNVLDCEIMLNNMRNFSFELKDKDRKDQFLDLVNQLKEQIELQ